MANSRSPSHDESLPLRPLFLAFFELTLFESVVEIQTMLRRTPLRSCGANAQKLSMSSYFSRHKLKKWPSTSRTPRQRRWATFLSAKTVMQPNTLGDFLIQLP